MVAQPRAMSVAEFVALPEDGTRHEFVRGQVRRMPPPKESHGRFEVRLLTALERYLDHLAEERGWRPDDGPDARDALVGFIAGGEFGMQIALPDDPDQIRGADGVYVSAEQLARTAWDATSYFPAVPDLVIEVVSPSESATDVHEKVQDYLAGGARRVWCVYPERSTLHVHRVAAATGVLHRDDTLADEELLPGFALPLRHIFAKTLERTAAMPAASPAADSGALP